MIQNYDDILTNVKKSQHSFDVKENVIKVLASISSGIPDAIYLANAGLNLGRSSVLRNKNVFIIQSPRMVERQVENAFTRALSIQMGSFPIEMKRVYEGMADSVTALVNFNGHKKQVLLGFNSSRSDPRVYQDIVNIARILKVVPEFPQDVVVLEEVLNENWNIFALVSVKLILVKKVRVSFSGAWPSFRGRHALFLHKI